MTTTYEKIRPYIQTILEKYEEVHQPSSDLDPYDALQDFLQEEVLEISVRCTTWSATHDHLEPDEFRVLLAWGGPSVQIEGVLDDFQPVDWDVVYMDWGTREVLQSYRLSEDEIEAVEWFLGGIYFG